MIEKMRGKYIPVCDVCGESLDPEDDFYDAVQAKKDAGWKTERYDDVWTDACDRCRQQEVLYLKSLKD